MATLSPSFEDFLTSLPDEKQQQALIWFSMNHDEEIKSDKLQLQNTLQTIEAMNSFDSLAIVSHLSQKDQVAYTVMNEFGAKIRHRAFFDKLVSKVQNRLQKLSTLKQLTDYSNN